MPEKECFALAVYGLGDLYLTRPSYFEEIAKPYGLTPGGISKIGQDYEKGELGTKETSCD